MGNIVLLDDLTINKIAAGEVIERPASVVKELLENSIDAGATNVTVEIKNGGITYIRITDNGKGFLPDDMEIAFERHATSKIRSAKDLEEVKSMGFRGEALASIAAIARVKLTSRREDSETGYSIVVEGGKVISKEETGCPKGTTIIVENLFYNTPVRYKFLKKDFTELGYVEDVVNRLALVNPGVAFKLQSLGKTLVQTNGNGNIKDTVYSIYGKDIAENIVNVDYQFEDMKVTGCIGKPSIAKANRTGQLFFVNGRFIKDKTLTSAAEQAFKGMVPAGKYGFLIINLEIDSHQIDVNVHPAKLEIRFQEENKVFKLVYHAIKDTLATIRDEVVQEENKEEDILELIKEGSNTKFDLKELERQRDYIYSKPTAERNLTEDIPISNTGNLVEDLYNDRLRQHAIEDVSAEFADPNEKEPEKTDDDKPEEVGINYFEDVLKFQEELKNGITESNDNTDSINNTTELVDDSKIEDSKSEEIKIEETKNEEIKEDMLATDDISIKDNLLDIDMPKDDTRPVEIPALSTNMDKFLNADIKAEEKEENKKDESKEEDKTADTENIENSFEEMYRKTFGIRPSEKVESKPEDEAKIKLETVEGINKIDHISKRNDVKYKFVGVGFSKFVIIEIENELYIIDQRVANERIIFERLKKSYYAFGNRESQMMLLPDVIELTSKQMDVARDNLLLLRKAGFEYEEFGDNTIKLVGVPDVCIELETKELFVEILDEINKVARTSKDEIEEKFIATIAKSAAKNEKIALTFEEVDALMKKLLILDNPFMGINNNPIAIKLSQSDIEKKISK